MTATFLPFLLSSRAWEIMDVQQYLLHPLPLDLEPIHDMNTILSPSTSYLVCSSSRFVIILPLSCIPHSLGSWGLTPVASMIAPTSTVEPSDRVTLNWPANPETSLTTVFNLIFTPFSIASSTRRSTISSPETL